MRTGTCKTGPTLPAARPWRGDVRNLRCRMRSETGLGIIAITNVPEYEERRQALLPVARRCVQRVLRATYPVQSGR